ncbi:hypothetical protein FOL47_001807, partial [Perkinsus chesapeaki]
SLKAVASAVSLLFIAAGFGLSAVLFGLCAPWLPDFDPRDPFSNSLAEAWWEKLFKEHGLSHDEPHQMRALGEDRRVAQEDDSVTLKVHTYFEPEKRTTKGRGRTRRPWYVNLQRESHPPVTR